LDICTYFARCPFSIKRAGQNKKPPKANITKNFFSLLSRKAMFPTTNTNQQPFAPIVHLNSLVARRAGA
jgi:hypothetical protein